MIIRFSLYPYYSPTSQMVLVPNPDYSSSTDPNNLHKVHASKITLIATGTTGGTRSPTTLASKAPTKPHGMPKPMSWLACNVLSPLAMPMVGMSELSAA